MVVDPMKSVSIRRGCDVRGVDHQGCKAPTCCGMLRTVKLRMTIHLRMVVTHHNQKDFWVPRATMMVTCAVMPTILHDYFPLPLQRRGGRLRSIGGLRAAEGELLTMAIP